MTDIFAELDDAMRQERIEKLWKEHGKSILALIIATILATAVLSAYRSWESGVRDQQTAALTALLSDPSFPDNIKDKTLDLRGGPKAVALLSAAGAFMDKGNAKDALAIYERAAGDPSLSSDFRQQAVLMAVRLKSSSPNPDTKSLLARLAPIAQNGKSPWHYDAAMEAATLYADVLHDYKAARAQLSALKDEAGTPPPLASRAAALDALYALHEGTKPQTPKKGPAP